MTETKKNILLIGCGGIGTISALNLETGGKATVTAVLRSNYQHVVDHGFNIRSCDHGVVKGFRPSTILPEIPNITPTDQPYDYILVTTKNYADIPPSLPTQIAPAINPSHTIIVLIQNGLNIERPFQTSFPSNIILSGVSYCGSHQLSLGEIVHEDSDKLSVGAFRNHLFATEEDNAAREFCDIYAAGGKCTAVFEPDVSYSRWRKLLYNACLNTLCAITDLDTGRLQLGDGILEDLVRPAMNEIRAAAKAVAGVELGVELVDVMIGVDPIDMYNPPSMLVDVRNGRYIEFENIIGEPLRDGLKAGVPMPTLKVLYALCRAIQWRTKERKGMVTIPPPVDHSVQKE